MTVTDLIKVLEYIGSKDGKDKRVVMLIDGKEEEITSLNHSPENKSVVTLCTDIS